MGKNCFDFNKENDMRTRHNIKKLSAKSSFLKLKRRREEGKERKRGRREEEERKKKGRRGGRGKKRGRENTPTT